MNSKTKCDIWLAINEDGDYVVSNDSDGDAAERLAEDVGGALCRVVKITAHVQAPVLTEVEIGVPDEAGATERVEVAA